MLWEAARLRMTGVRRAELRLPEERSGAPAVKSSVKCCRKQEGSDPKGSLCVYRSFLRYPKSHIKHESSI